jgi:hypothetical protein
MLERLRSNRLTGDQILKGSILALAAGSALAITCPANAAVKTAVLFHGAFADGSG